MAAAKFSGRTEETRTGRKNQVVHDESVGHKMVNWHSFIGSNRDLEATNGVNTSAITSTPFVVAFDTSRLGGCQIDWLDPYKAVTCTMHGRISSSGATVVTKNRRKAECVGAVTHHKEPHFDSGECS